MFEETYCHSGRFAVAGIPMMLIAGLIVGGILGVVYAFAIAWIPIVYLNMLLSGGFGMIMGFVVAQAGYYGRVRNPLLTGLFGFTSAAFGLYISWAVDGAARFGISEVPVLLSPAALSEYISIFYNTGFWTIGKGGSVSGIPLAVIWGIEALMVTGLGGMIGYMRFATTPYCENCDWWTTKISDFGRIIVPEETPEFTEQLVAGDVSVISKCQPATESTEKHLAIAIADCPSCSGSAYMSVSQVTITMNSKGEPQTATQTLVENRQITHDSLESLKSALASLTAV